jgi:hypothetical protein
MKKRIAATGFEFATPDDLDRHEANARYWNNHHLLMKILLERQRRRWSDYVRQQYAGLAERWYL